MSDPAPIPRVSPFNALLGVEVEDLESGGCRLTLSPRAEHRNELGSVHGGLITTLLDGAMGRAAGRLVGPGGFCATTQLSVQFLEPAEGDLAAESRITRAGGRVAFVEAECRRADGTLVARAQGVWALKRPQG